MKRTVLPVVAFAGVLWIGARVADSCGPFFSDVVFTTYHGALPGEFESGRPGVLRPHYYRRDLLLSYRALSGVPLSGGVRATELREFGSPDRAAAWMKARKEIPGLPAATPIDPDRKVPGSDFQSYANCLSDAFEAAAATLRKRAAQWGATSPELSEWVHGQDQVFANCSAGTAIPEEAASPDPLLVADRKYQIAAAQFYSEQYAKAEAGFDQIATDGLSPWHSIAPYLAARSCIRRGTIGADEDGLSQAATRLQAILADPTQKQFQASAEGLMGFVQARIDPAGRLVELGHQLMQPGKGAYLGRVLTDYTNIWDRMDPDRLKPVVESSDVANWIDTFQLGGPALEKWRDQHTLPWLVAALVSLDAKNPAANEVIAAAHAVKPDSPAYPTVTYYGILQRIRRGELDAARQWADQALARKPSDSAVNLLRSERLFLARDWTEFLRYAPRKPVALGDDMGLEMPLGDAEARKLPVAYDADATGPINSLAPLSRWIDATQNSLVPVSLQARIAQAGWVRAVVLRDRPAARTLAERVGRLKPALAAEMRAYLADSDPDAANFRAVFLMLRGAGFEPVVRSRSGRSTPVMERDIFRDNWWSLSDAPGKLEPGAATHEALFDLYPTGRFGPADFLPKDQRSAGEDEWRRLLQRAANGVDYLCSETLDWARAHPGDPRVPQALHLAVEATHYGPRGDQSGRYSKQAFDLLHRRYPKSEWTAKTKFWY